MKLVTKYQRKIAQMELRNDHTLTLVKKILFLKTIKFTIPNNQSLNQFKRDNKLGIPLYTLSLTR
jgi:hypothetical protein